MARDAVIDEIKRLDSAWFPLYEYPEDAVRAASNLARIRELRDDDLGEPRTFAVDEKAAAKILARTAATGGGWLPGVDAFQVLEAYGIRCAPIEAAESVEAAVASAAKRAGPVALKLDGAAFLHKSDVGGVALGLEGAAVREAAKKLEAIARRASPDRPWRFLVQSMARPGTELVMGVRSDPVFGPLLLVGLGGIYVEILKDVRFGLVPLTPVLARRMLSRLRAFPILKGARGGKGVDLDAVEEALLRLSALVDAHPSILDVEMNPVIARADGVEAVDV